MSDCKKVREGDTAASSQVEDRLQERERFLRTLIGNLPGVVYRCRIDDDWTSEFISDGVYEITGYTAQDIVEKRTVTWSRVIHPEDLGRVRAELRRLVNENRLLDNHPFQVSYRVITATGEIRHVRDRSRPVLDLAGKPDVLEGFITDITERKLAEERLRQSESRYRVLAEERAALLASEQAARCAAERAREQAEHAHAQAMQANRAKDDFLQMVSHEFRTPLTTIKTLVRLMQAEGDVDAERRENLETIAAECDRQIDMIANILDVSRIEEGSMDFDRQGVSLADVLRLCERIVRPAAETRRQSLTIATRSSPIVVRGDAKALRRAFCAIIENAIKYTGQGGAIIVAIGDGPLRSSESGDQVEVHFADTGRGIEPEDVPHVFEKFYRGKQRDRRQDPARGNAHGSIEMPGVGLGLYLAHRIVASCGGSIEIESTSGRGTRFTVLLPVWNDSHDGGVVPAPETGESSTA
jgi:PAS domain S-box-containing protein